MTNLGFWDDLDGNLLALKLTLFEPSRASIPKMPSTHLFPNLQPTGELLREPKPLIQLHPTFVLPLLWYRRRRLLAVPSRQYRTNMFRRRRRRERSPEKTPWSGTGALACRRRLFQVMGGTGAVEGEER